MKVLEPKELEKRRTKRTQKQKSTRRKRSLVPVIFFVLVVYLGAIFLIPSPALKAEVSRLSVPPAESASLPWPTYGESAVGAVGYGLLAKNGEQKQLPIASVAKVITALAVLKQHPLSKGEDGEQISITAQDEQTYKEYYSQNQSVIEVKAGQELSLYQALQALLLPSANNMADILVRWAFGSTENYLAFANPFTKTLGMQNTVIADASGFSPGTMSTATDLALLAEIAMNHPVISEIVAQPQAVLPVAGVVRNVNYQLGTDGIVGIKTGNTNEAGGVYLFAATRPIGIDSNITVVGAIMGADNLSIAITDSKPLIDGVFKKFQISTPIVTNQVVGRVYQKAGKQVDIIVKQGEPVVSWVGQATKIDITTEQLHSTLSANERVGTIKISAGNKTYEMSLIVPEAVVGHSFVWRLRHGGGYF